MGNLIGDVRYALRSLARQPTFTAVAILTLVLGIGTNTAIFSVIKAVLLNQLPYQDASRLVVLREQNPDGSADLVAPLTFLDWQQQSHAVPAMAAFRQLRYAFAGNGEPLDVPSVRGTANLFAVLRASALIGRVFSPEEGTPGADRVAVLSQAFWERHYGGSPGALGQTIQLDAQPYTVVGVMPAAFDFPPSAHVDVWTPLTFDPNDAHGRSRKARSLSIVGRLADGVGQEQAQREMTVIAGRLATTFPDSNTGWGARVISAQEQLVTTVRPALLLISAAVGFLLLIVCANVANLMLARLSSRRGEIAVRAALGAGRMQLVRQVLTESFVLSGIGGGLGLLVAWAGVRLVRALPEGSLPRMQEVRLDGGVLLFALLISIGVALLFGLVPGAAGVARGIARHDERLLGDDPPFGRTAAEHARGHRGRARPDAAGRRRPDDTQLRSADACRPRLRARQSAGGADLPAAVEVPHRPRSHPLLHGHDPARRRDPGGSRRGGRQCAADVSGRHRLCAAVHDRRPRGAGQRRGAAGRHPHRHARLFRDDEDRAAQGPFHRRPRPSGRARHRGHQRDHGAALLRRRGSARQDRAQSARQGRGGRRRSATSSTTGSTASRGPNCSCPPGSSR